MPSDQLIAIQCYGHTGGWHPPHQIHGHGHLRVKSPNRRMLSVAKPIPPFQEPLLFISHNSGTQSPPPLHSLIRA